MGPRILDVKERTNIKMESEDMRLLREVAEYRMTMNNKLNKDIMNMHNYNQIIKI